jgi:4-amino-4-deoxy-L-arabinose transferase-like glycosyltransferase
VTATSIRRAPEAARHAANRAGARHVAPGLVAAAFGGLTLLIRLVLHGQAFDLFGDEVIYNALGRSVVHGGFPTFEGGAFFLHPPGFFYLEAGWARLLGTPAGLIAQIYQMRILNALLAGATAVVLVLLATRAASLRAGAVAGLLFALDPFCIRQNDRVLLETPMMLLVLLGYLVLAPLIERRTSRGRPAARAIAAGLLFGCAVLTKDEAVLLTMLPLIAAAILRWGPGRALTLLTVGVTALPYSIYLAVVAANGYMGALWQAKTAGLQRMLGIVQTSGFHSSSGGSLLPRLIAESPYFATTYISLALAVPALVLILRRGGPLPRMLGLMHCAAALALGYALVLGTLEEGELYLLIVPSLLIIPVAATLLGGRSRARRPAAGGRRGRARAAVIIAALAAVVCVNLATCVQWLRQPDDGFARLLSYMAVHVPAGTRVTGAADPEDVAQYALAGNYNVGLWVTPAALSHEHVRYVVVPWGEIDEGYTSLSRAQVRHLVVQGRVVFSFHGRTYGDLALYLLPRS